MIAVLSLDKWFTWPICLINQINLLYSQSPFKIFAPPLQLIHAPIQMRKTLSFQLKSYTSMGDRRLRALLIREITQIIVIIHSSYDIRIPFMLTSAFYFESLNTLFLWKFGALSETPSQDLRLVEGTPSSSNEIVETNIDSDEFDITPQADSTHIAIATDECQFPPQQHDFETCDAFFPESFDLTETDTSAESKIGCTTFECQAI